MLNSIATATAAAITYASTNNTSSSSSASSFSSFARRRRRRRAMKMVEEVMVGLRVGRGRGLIWYLVVRMVVANDANGVFGGRDVLVTMVRADVVADVDNVVVVGVVV